MSIPRHVQQSARNRMVPTSSGVHETAVTGGSVANDAMASMTPTVRNIQNVMTFTSSSRPYFAAVAIWRAKNTAPISVNASPRCMEKLSSATSAMPATQSAAAPTLKRVSGSRAMR